MIEHKIKNLRVHIVPIGFEIDRAVQPLIKNRADKVYLISHLEGDDAAKKHLDEIEKQLNANNIIHFIERCDIKQINSFFSKIKELIEKEKDNHIYINVSSGSKLSTMASTIAAMMFKEDNIDIKLYYVDPDNYDEVPETTYPGIRPLLSIGYKESKEINTFKLNLPEKHLIDVLKEIKKISKDRVCKRSDIIDFVYQEKISNCLLEKIPLKKDNTYRSIITKNGMKVRRNIIDKLLHDWNYINIEGKYKNAHIKLTDMGEEVLVFFE